MSLSKLTRSPIPPASPGRPIWKSFVISLSMKSSYVPLCPNGPFNPGSPGAPLKPGRPIEG
jgi:hypothetical protein